MAKSKLGKGLDSLISQNITADDTVKEYDIKNIIPNKDQPRKEFSKEKIESLSESIKEYGVIQPIIIRKKGIKYEIVAGERRYRAAKLAGLKKIPAVLKDIDDETFHKMALIENLQREDLNPIEEAMSYDYMIKEYEISQSELSKVVGKSRTYITNTLRLLKLDNRVKKLVEKGILSSGHGRTLLSLEDKSVQYDIANLAIKNDLSVRALESYIRNLTKLKKKTKKEDNPIYKNLEDHLKSYFGTKVSLEHKKNKGKIVISYFSDDELQRILELLDFDFK